MIDRISNLPLCQICYEGDLNKFISTLKTMNDDLIVDELSKLDSSERNCLHWATLSNQGVSIIPILLNTYKLNVNCPDGLGWTPLMIAVSAGRLDAVNILLEFNANVDCLNNRKQNVLHFAISKGRFELIDQLLKHSANASNMINCPDVNGVTPFHRAVGKCSKNLVYRLVSEYGASVRQQDKEGNHCFHLIAIEDRHDLIQLFLSDSDNKDLLNIKNNDGLVPFQLASNRQLKEALMKA